MSDSFLTLHDENHADDIPDEPCCSSDHRHGYLEDKKGYQRRLRRIEGQVRGIQKMIDDEKYCIDILTQISATTRALQSVALGLLDEHLRSCVVQAARRGDEQANAILTEAHDAIARMMRM